MLRRIVRLSLVHPAIVLLLAVALLGYGVMVIGRASYDVFPEFVPAQASVQTEAPGMTPDQVEALVTRPLETAINGATGVTAVRSESIQGLSVINVTFAEGSDPYRARQVVAEAVSEATGQLPTGTKTPTLGPLISSTMDLLKIGFTGGSNPQALRDLVRWTVVPRLLATPGVARASVFGGDQRRLEVRIRPTDLLARGVAVTDVAQAVKSATEIRGGGFSDTSNQHILVEPHAPDITAASLALAPLQLGNGATLRIGDVATVADAAAPKFGDALVMGKPGVLVTLSSQYGANTLETTRRVEAALSELEPALSAQGVRVYPALHRPANFIETGLAGIRTDLLIGTGMIAFVLLLFMRDLRIAFITFVSIPLSLLAALIVLDRTGYTINTMTLGGLAVALGVVIDDAIVDVENIVRRLRLAPAGSDRRELIAAASVEVRAPVVYATYVLALSVAPILMLTGLQGAFFSPLAWSFLLATLASLAIAMTVAPALALLLLGNVRPHDEPHWLDRAKSAHARLLQTVCSHPGEVLAGTIGTGFAAALVLLSFGGELLPAFREGHYIVHFNGPPGASIAWMKDMGQRVSRDLLALPQVATVEQQIGRAERGEDTFPPNFSEIHVALKRGTGQDEDQALAGMHQVLARYPAIQAEALSFLGERIGESLSGETAKVAIGIYGGDLDTLDSVAAQVASALRSVPGAADVQVKSQPGTPLLEIKFDPTRMGLHGISASDAYDAIELAFQGATVGQVAEADRFTDVAIVLPPGAVQQPEAVGSVLIRASDGTTVPLRDIAIIRVTEGRTSISHDGGRRRQMVTANPSVSDVAGFVDAAQRVISRQVKLPPGVYLEFSGVAEGEAAATRQVLFNVSVAAIGIVVLLVLAFGGRRPALLILSGAPFALAGGVLAVAATGGVLSLGALVGFVTLFGVSSRNGILLISHVDHLVAQEGAPRNLDTILQATRERVTPILMTALVTGLGLAPLALEAGQAGREVQGPMADVILGGLITSTMMSLFLLPALVLRYRWEGKPEGTDRDAAAAG